MTAMFSETRTVETTSRRLRPAEVTDLEQVRAERAASAPTSRASTHPPTSPPTPSSGASERSPDRLLAAPASHPEDTADDLPGRRARQVPGHR